MGGRIDWAGVEVIAEMLGEEDIEAFITRLAAIRDWRADNPD